MPPIVQFHRVIPDAPAPTRADRTAAGTLPVRAAQYCDAVTQASAFGWWVYPPLAITLLWDGETIHWTWPGHDAWLPLTTAQYPGLRAAFDTAAPDHLRGTAPPFLTALPEPGMLQIWTGLFARTAPGWSLLTRAPANLPPAAGLATYEGIVETDRWFGPLFTNLRLTRTDTPIRLDPTRPLLQLQPLPRAAYAEATLSSHALNEGLAEADWSDYETAIAGPALRGEHTPGRYAIAARRRRKSECPYAMT